MSFDWRTAVSGLAGADAEGGPMAAFAMGTLLSAVLPGKDQNTAVLHKLDEIESTLTDIENQISQLSDQVTSSMFDIKQDGLDDLRGFLKTAWDDYQGIAQIGSEDTYISGPYVGDPVSRQTMIASLVREIHDHLLDHQGPMNTRLQDTITAGNRNPGILTAGAIKFRNDTGGWLDSAYHERIQGLYDFYAGLQTQLTTLQTEYTATRTRTTSSPRIRWSTT